MLDDFRRDASFEVDEPAPVERPRQVRRQFLGMTAGQRLVIAFLLLLMTVLLSSACLVITQKVALF